MKRGELRAIEVEMFNQRDMATIDLRCSLLDQYWRDGLLSPERDQDLGRIRYDAGQRLIRLYEATGYRQQVSAAYGQRTSPGAELSDEADAFVTAKRREYHTAVRKLHECRSSVINLCIHETGPVNLHILVRGLDILISHWGLH